MHWSPGPGSKHYNVISEVLIALEAATGPLTCREIVDHLQEMGGSEHLTTAGCPGCSPMRCALVTTSRLSMNKDKSHGIWWFPCAGQLVQ